MKHSLIMSLLLISINYLITSSNGADCSWTKNGATIDLSGLDASTLDGSDGSFDYYYTPCENGVKCTKSTGEDFDVMADQLNSAGNCASYLAEWDSNISPSYSSSNGGTFTFKYENGESSATCTSARKFTVIWECDSSRTVPSVESVGETGTCEYQMKILSSYACSTASGSAISVGWILIIAVIGIIFLYCIIGYVICARKNPENGWGNVKGNTPHVDFWCAIPKWTWAGCCVTKDFIVNGVNKIRGKGTEGGYSDVDDE